MSAQVDAEQTALAGVVYQHEGEFGAWVDCSEAVFNFWQRSGTLKSRKLYTSAQQPAAGTYPEQWRLDDRELNAGRLKALHRGLELARKWSAGTGTHGHTDRMVRDMADELRSALSSQDGDYAHQTAPVVDDACMARALEWVRTNAAFEFPHIREHIPAIEEAIAAYDPKCGARTVRVVDDELPGMWSQSDFMGGAADAADDARQLVPSVDDAMVDRYLAAQAKAVQEIDDAWGNGGKAASYLHPVREACRAGLTAALTAARAQGVQS